MSSSLDVCFMDYDFSLPSSGWGRKQPAELLFRNIRHHSWQAWAGFTGRRKLLLPCRLHSNAIPHTLTSVQPAAGLTEERGWVAEGGKNNRREDWETNLTPRRKTFRVLYQVQRRPAKRVSSEVSPKHKRAHRWCEWKNTIICFSLLRNLLSRFQPCTPPASILSSLPPPFCSSNCEHTLRWINSQRQETGWCMRGGTRTFVSFLLYILHFIFSPWNTLNTSS